MTAPRNVGGWPERRAERLEDRIVIERDGTITARSGKVEYGQGIRTGFAAIVAEELSVPIDRVKLVLGETDVVPFDMGTFGSMSVSMDGAVLRSSAALARSFLLDRAARRLGAPRKDLTLRDGRVLAPGNASMSYADLTAGEPLCGPIPTQPAAPFLTAPSLLEPRRVGARAIVTGEAHYPADVRLPGLLRGRVVQPPFPGARLVRANDAAARSINGVVSVVRDGDFVGVVAERDDQAVAACQALDATWSSAREQTEPPLDVELRHDPETRAAFAGDNRVLEARYHLPHISHACIGPSAAVADVRRDEADLYVATQRPFGLRDAVAALLGVAADRVRVHPQTMGGLYGRGNAGDAPVDATRLSRAVSRPVLVQWSRADEFKASPNRPMLDAGVRAALDRSNRICGWDYQATTNPHTYGGDRQPPRVVAMTAGRSAIPPYSIGAMNVQLRVVPAELRTGAFRSLGAAPHVFAIESFIDELAHACSADPIEFRLRHVTDDRLRRVLEMVRERSGWSRRSREPHSGFGVACAIYNETYVAQVAEVVTSSAHVPRIERVWCAVDAGRLVHRDGAANQIEGGVQQAASWAMYESLRYDGGVVTTGGWYDYRIATALDAPRQIDVEFVDAPARPSSGIGEPGSVPTAAALANAIFDANGERIRRLPLVGAVDSPGAARALEGAGSGRGDRGH